MARKMKKFGVGGKAKKDYAEISEMLKKGIAKGPELGDTDVTKRADASRAARKVEPAKAPEKKQSFGEAFKAARAAAVKAGRDPDKEIFTWGGQKKVAKMAGSSPSRSAPKATAPKAKVEKPSVVPAAQRSGRPLTAATPGLLSTRAQTDMAAAAKAKSKALQDQAAANRIRLLTAKPKRDQESITKGSSGRAYTPQELSGMSGYKKGGSIDGIAVRGKTRAKGAK